ncbi:hypothetical protein Tco_1506683 [Tanacetum coccineum]
MIDCWPPPTLRQVQDRNDTSGTTLQSHHKDPSKDSCFIPQGDINAFLSSHLTPSVDDIEKEAPAPAVSITK